MSGEADGLASGNDPAFPATFCCAEDTWLADFGLTGSPGINARNLQQALHGPRSAGGQYVPDAPMFQSLDPAARDNGSRQFLTGT
jgi:hypothetical protein